LQNYTKKAGEAEQLKEKIGICVTFLQNRLLFSILFVPLRHQPNIEDYD
jgi:hypothetical protein